ncbi:serine/threonine-protein kinase [Stigmatella sp. ncwal1]|uniref:Serine/threonine-protein kinase n=1 Tax=Stigmatella ashevillensis TaxID=2995309 RepID=A0ABT5DJJ0_9BACT|nr:serine/threonine-protein kinase [Stigmatella ashevillena]MDC0712531.1 serine/threonine-protein kinase [Stigmatella ashevillena]
MTPPGEEALYGEELSPGALVGSWVVEHVHYRGPVSWLYRARDTRTGEAAALKVMHSRFTATHTALRRFRQEATTLQRLHHPHIVDILGHGELADGRPFIAMEWLPGRDLAAELAARGPLSPKEALEVLEQVGAALEAAHQAGVVHRDLKAQNVVCLRGGAEAVRVKLVDFGVAKDLSPQTPGASSLTKTGTVLGTPLFMAPEQIRGEKPDTRTDLYALGLLLFHLVTGKPPFLGTTPHEVEEQHLHAPPPRPSERAPVPAALDAVVHRCLQKRREERYPHVAAMLEALRRAVHGGQGAVLAERTMALYAEASVEGEPDDAALERMDALLASASATAREAGLEIRVDGASCVLAMAVLPEAEHEEREARARLLASALALIRIAEALPSPPRVTLNVTVHVDATRRWREKSWSTPSGTGGLLCLSGWTVASDGHALVATEAALRGLETDFLAEPLQDMARTGHRRVMGLR